MTPESNPDPEREFNPPDLSQWWLVQRRIPFVEMSREELDSRRSEMAPRTFKRLDFCRQQEQRIIRMLEKPSWGKRDRKHLLSALESTRHSISNLLETITDWGLSRPPAE